MSRFIHPRWHKTFLGIFQQHTYWLYKVIDEILNENPQVEEIIEIGTGNGALSVFLGLQCFQRQLKPLITIDLIRPEKVERLFELLKIDFIQGDCFEKLRMPNKPVFLFCDGGNKSLEFNTFVPLLAKGSIIGIHDWGREVDNSSVNLSLVEPIKQSEWNESPDNILTSFWRVL